MDANKETLEKVVLELYTGNKGVQSNRKVRSLYRWLARVTSVEACWIDGMDAHHHPVWGCIKRISQNAFALLSKRLALPFLVAAPLLLASPVMAQTSVELSELEGINGSTFLGIDSYDFAGQSVSSGDINGDGIEDLIIGAPGYYNDPGEVYVVFGDTSGFSASLELSDLDGTNGFTLNGIDTYDRAGSAVAAGDINGDGVEDLIIGTSNYYNDPEEVYVVFGDTSGFSASLELSDLDGTNGFTLNGINTDDRAGSAVAPGDINGDGVADLIIGAKAADPNGNYSGEVYVVFGDTSGFSATFELSDLDGSNGFTLNGINTDDQVGDVVASGDINGDGVDDVLIGVEFGDPNGNFSGEVYVVFGDTSGFSASFELSDLDGSNGFTLNGIKTDDRAGKAVASGDINGDGISDILIGADRADPNGNLSGEVYVVFGDTDGFSSSFELSDLDGSNGFTLNGINVGDRVGQAVASGDINGDEIADLIIGTQNVDLTTRQDGQTYVVFGFDNTSTSSIELSDLDGANGFALNGSAYDFSGSSVASGDINGDGIDDVIVGAKGYAYYYENPTGKAHVFFNNTPQEVTGSEGFRTLSAPNSGTVFDELLGEFWTQGFTGSDGSSGDDNAWTLDEDTQAWTALTNQATDSLSAGNGFLFYLFSDDNGPHVSGDTGFPKRISANQFGGDGIRNTGSVTPISTLADNDFFFAGNPYLFPIDWDELTKTNLSQTVYIYDQANATWQTWNGTAGDLTDGEIAAFQGFFIQGDGGSGSLTIEEADTVSTSVNLLKRSPILRSFSEGERALKILAEADGLSANTWLSFQEGGNIGDDPFDGLALTPFASRYLRLTTIIENSDELQINALPIDSDKELRFPLELTGLNISGIAKLSFEGLDRFKDWRISILDTETDQKHILSEKDILELPITPISSKQSSSLLTLAPIQAKTNNDGYRFEIIVTPNALVNNEHDQEAPLTLRLDQNYPNPFNPVTTIAYSLPNPVQVQLKVFDLMGRKVAMLINEKQHPGQYSFRFDASQLSSGTYFYQLKAGNITLTRKLTLIK